MATVSIRSPARSGRLRAGRAAVDGDAGTVEGTAWLDGLRAGAARSASRVVPLQAAATRPQASRTPATRSRRLLIPVASPSTGHRARAGVRGTPSGVLGLPC